MFEQNEELQSNGASTLLATLLGIVIRVFLAITTAGFFAAYAADIWSWLLPPTLAANAAAVTGVVLIDGLAAGWTYLRRAAADTAEQQNYASVGAMLDMTLSLLVTAVFVMLTTPLLQASVSPEIYTVMINLAAWAGILIAVVAFAGNGVLWHFYANASAGAVQQLRFNELRALATKAEHDLDAERLKMWTEKALDNIRQELPGYTSDAATRSKEAYLAQRFAASHNHGAGRIEQPQEDADFLAEPPQPHRRNGQRR